MLYIGTKVTVLKFKKKLFINAFENTQRILDIGDENSGFKERRGDVCTMGTHFFF